MICHLSFSGSKPFGDAVSDNDGWCVTVFHHTALLIQSAKITLYCQLLELLPSASGLPVDKPDILTE